MVRALMRGRDILWGEAPGGAGAGSTAEAHGEEEEEQPEGVPTTVKEGAREVFVNPHADDGVVRRRRRKRERPANTPGDNADTLWPPAVDSSGAPVKIPFSTGEFKGAATSVPPRQPTTTQLRCSLRAAPVWRTRHHADRAPWARYNETAPDPLEGNLDERVHVGGGRSE